MGWKDECGLGARNDGIISVLEVECRENRAGLGYYGPPLSLQNTKSIPHTISTVYDEQRSLPNLTNDPICSNTLEQLIHQTECNSAGCTSATRNTLDTTIHTKKIFPLGLENKGWVLQTAPGKFKILPQVKQFKPVKFIFGGMLNDQLS